MNPVQFSTSQRGMVLKTPQIQNFLSGTSLALSRSREDNPKRIGTRIAPTGSVPCRSCLQCRETEARRKVAELGATRASRRLGDSSAFGQQANEAGEPRIETQQRPKLG
jgi:hypothetical protein